MRRKLGMLPGEKKTRDVIRQEENQGSYQVRRKLGMLSGEKIASNVIR